MARNPRLCGVNSYCSPGFPKPTTRNSTSSGIHLVSAASSQKPAQGRLGPPNHQEPANRLAEAALLQQRSVVRAGSLTANYFFFFSSGFFASGFFASGFFLPSAAASSSSFLPFLMTSGSDDDAPAGAAPSTGVSTTSAFSVTTCEITASAGLSSFIEPVMGIAPARTDWFSASSLTST